MSNSSTYKIWDSPNSNTEGLESIKAKTGFSTMVSQILLDRVGANATDAEQWISPRLENIIDPDQLTHCASAAKLLSECISKKVKIGIFSDYDVDGISSAALLSQVIEALGGECHSFIPDRMQEGYGLSQAAVERSFSQIQPQLLVILDCGTRSEEQLAWISKQGTQTVVVDHHSREDQPTLPSDCILINPHLPEQEQSEFQSHCTVGLVFKLVHSILRFSEKNFGGAREKVNLKELLDLVALGTVADLVPLRNENRIFVHHGLKRLGKTSNCGLRALLQVADVDVNNPLSSTDIGFRLGPRINAGGRIETGTIALDLLQTKDNRLAFDIARKLDAINSERRSIERKVAEQATHDIGDTPKSGIVVWNREWHPGVVGIVAGRLARSYHRPSIVLGWDGKTFKGSGRGIPGLDLLAIMAGCEVQPTQWGGHPMAMGMSIDEDVMDDFAEAFSRAVDESCGGVLPPKRLRIDGVADVSAINRQQVLEIEALGPFGQENPEPILKIANIRLEAPPKLMGREHIRFDLPGSRGIQVIGWRMADRMPPTGEMIDLAMKLSRSWWRGRESVRGELVDWRPSKPL